MSSRPVTPVSPSQGTHPDPSIHSTQPMSNRVSSRPVSYMGNQHTQPIDGISQSNYSQAAIQDPSAIAQANDLHDEVINQDQESPELPRTDSHMSGSQTLLPSRGGTLKKKGSVHKSASLRRTPSKRSSYAGSERNMQMVEKEKYGEKEKYEETPESNSALYCPVPTSGNPTELLATRFQAWRKVLKDLINYFREVHKSYETRGKTLMSSSNVLNNSPMPSNFMSSGGLGDAVNILRDFHKRGLTEANKARDLENEVIIQLTGLRSDLQQKIKEIKSLSGDFKNSVDKEKDVTKRTIASLQESLGMVDQDAATTVGKGDPFLVKLSLDKQLEKQIDEENYLHRAYLNLEASGRELESIVVGEIQKAYNVLAGILRREADENYDTAEKLKEGPLALSKDHEWDAFTTNNNQMVDPRMPIRQVSHIVYPGKDHPAAIEVKSGMLERKSKYLKNYTPGWYVLSPTHLHEFKSADRIAFQTPVMSLYLPEQKLGSQSEVDSSSHKFMLKGRQTGGSMHRGAHAWVFRAESRDTMLAWITDIKELTEKRGEERNEFVRRTHARSFSGTSQKPVSIISSEGGLEDDEADRVAFSGEQSVRGNSIPDGTAAAGLGGVGAAAVLDDEDTRSEAGWRPPPQRPAPGGRFPSDLNVQRGLAAPLSPSSGDSSDHDRDVIAAAGALPGSGVPFANTLERHTDLQPESGVPFTNTPERPTGLQPDTQQTVVPAPQQTPANHYSQGQHSNIFPTHQSLAPHDADSQYGEWMAPIAAGAGGAAVGAGAMHLHHNHDQEERDRDRTPTAAQRLDGEIAIPQYGESSAPIMVSTAAPIDAPTEPRAMSEATTAPSSAVAHTVISETDVGTLSTVPTSTSYSVPGDSTGMFDANGVYVGPKSNKTAPTEYVLRPAERTQSSYTISHLHVPGEFPMTPALNEDSRIYQDVVLH